ncbi:concanavalin A-like lectin/glucanase domain-containing protein [Mycena floridula]|nr:concanavalin A-like lectin/glucanase domain-containing protein [Mycena floridula]
MIEIRAKMPRGDWMWPAMWMLPVPKDEIEGDVNNPTKSTDGFYGAWPRSGEIDIVESRGNGIEYTARGRNYVQSSLNWGPTALLNSVAKSYSWWSDKRTGFDEGFHTYRLEWTPDFIRVSIDTRLHTLLDIPFKQDFFTRGDYPDTFTNTSTGAIQQLTNPWSAASEGGAKAAPFDRPFYLILNLAVGSRTGWFPEGQGDKPWLDGSSVAMKTWWEKRAEWLPTWPGYSSGDIRDRALVVDYVKMWEMC